jgi:hypothetical protein
MGSSIQGTADILTTAPTSQPTAPASTTGTTEPCAVRLESVSEPTATTASSDGGQPAAAPTERPQRRADELARPAQPHAAPAGGHAFPTPGAGDAQGNLAMPQGVGDLPKDAYTSWIRRVGAEIIDLVPAAIVGGIGLYLHLGEMTWLLVWAYWLWNLGYA